MIRALLRVVLLLVIVAAVAAFFFGYRFGDRDRFGTSDTAIGTSGAQVDVDRAKETGARVGETVAEGANKLERAASDAGLTAKIKSKMALDDTIDAIDIDVDTAGAVVTLNGYVHNAQQHERALQLARETKGVVSVVDNLTIR